MKNNLFATALITLIFYIGISFAQGTFSVNYWERSNGLNAICVIYVLIALLINVVIADDNSNEEIF